MPEIVLGRIAPLNSKMVMLQVMVQWSARQAQKLLSSQLPIPHMVQTSWHAPRAQMFCTLPQLLDSSKIQLDGPSAR